MFSPSSETDARRRRLAPDPAAATANHAPPMEQPDAPCSRHRRGVRDLSSALTTLITSAPCPSRIRTWNSGSRRPTRRSWVVHVPGEIPCAARYPRSQSPGRGRSSPGPTVRQHHGKGPRPRRARGVSVGLLAAARGGAATVQHRTRSGVGSRTTPSRSRSPRSLLGQPEHGDRGPAASALLRLVLGGKRGLGARRRGRSRRRRGGSVTRLGVAGAATSEEEGTNTST